MTFLKLFLILIFLVLEMNYSYANDLTEKYRELMDSSPTKKEESTQKSGGVDKLKSIQHEIESEINELKRLKKDTFESSKEFENRKKNEVSKLERRINALIKNKYPAGILTMDSYNADTEVLEGNIEWKEEFEYLLANIQGIDKVSIQIPRSEAKRLFSKIKDHPIFVTVRWSNNRLYMRKIFLWISNTKTYYAYNEKMYGYKVYASRNNREKIITCDISNERYMIVEHSSKYCPEKPYDTYPMRQGMIRAECKFRSFKEAVKSSCM